MLFVDFPDILLLLISILILLSLEKIVCVISILLTFKIYFVSQNKDLP